MTDNGGYRPWTPRTATAASPAPAAPQSQLPPSDGTLAAFLTDPVARAYIGPNGEEFIQRWETKFSVVDNVTVIPLKTTFSPLAVFFGLFYLLYRKMYRLCAIILAGAVVADAMVILLRAPVDLTFWRIGWWVFWIGFAFFFDSLYLRHIVSRVRAIKSDQPDIQQQIATAARRGGTNWAAPFVGVPLFIAALAAVEALLALLG
jgi:hypothetical protein